MRRIFIAGVCIELPAHPELDLWLAEIAPFTIPSFFDALIRVNLTVGEPDDHPPEISSVAEGSFVYRRPDLSFVIDAERRLVTAWVDGYQGGFEAVVQLCLQTALLPLGGIVVHASAGVVDGVGWLMPGQSGDGKSTAAREGGFDLVLSDEMVVIRKQADGAHWLYGSPFWSEGRVLPHSTETAPLVVVAKLLKAPHPSVEDLDVSVAIAHLLRCITLYERSECARAKAFELAGDVVENCRSVLLRFPKEGPWVSAVKFPT